MAVDQQKLQTAKQKVLTDPYDIEAWLLITKDIQSRKIDDRSREVFEKLVGLFPTSGKFWKLYIEQEMKGRNFEKVEKLFQRSLMKVLHIELWKTYLLYVKETKASLSNYKEKMAQAYDFALDKMGMDISSFTLWNDYVKFLKGVEAAGSYAENQKITAIRKIYQRGIVNPMINIEQFWKDYVTFEQGINPIIAEKMTNERSREYMNSRRVAKEYEACTRGLNKAAPCVPPTGTSEEFKQLELWQKYISWERSNPLRVEDLTLIAKRVMFAYEQCLLCMGHHANVWYEAANFLQENSRLLQEKGDVDAAKMLLDQASAIYERAIGGVLSKNMLLHFAYADYEEQQVKLDKVHKIYTKFLEYEDIDPTLANTAKESLCTKFQYPSVLIACYIQYMKFCRRSEGTASARQIFKKAREDTRSTHHVYVAAALMEYYCTKDQKIASNVFELGFKKFKADEDYILAYVDYLSHLNEDNNTRVLFERSLTSGALKPEQQIEIWNKFLEFEANIGDMPSIIKIEKRRAQAMEKEMEISETSQLIDRYKFLSLYPCSSDELRYLGYHRNVSKLTNHSANSAIPAPNITNGNSGMAQTTSTDVDNMPRPDVSQMIPFKPKKNWIPGEHRMPGGGFPMPQLAAELCQTLPPPTSFHGPFVMIDKLMEVFNNLNLPSQFKVSSGSNGQSMSLFNTAKNAQWALEGLNNTDNSRKKRKSRNGVESDDEEETAGENVPANDIYRKRQQKRMK